MKEPILQEAFKLAHDYVAKGLPIPADLFNDLNKSFPGFTIKVAEYQPKLGVFALTLESEKPVGYSILRELKDGETVALEGAGPIGKPVVKGQSVATNKIHIVMDTSGVDGSFKLKSVLAGDYAPPSLPIDLAEQVVGKSSAQAKKLAHEFFLSHPEYQKYWTEGDLTESADYWRNHVLINSKGFNQGEALKTDEQFILATVKRAQYQKQTVTLHLKSGETPTGKIIITTEDSLTIEVEGNKKIVKFSDLDIDKSAESIKPGAMRERYKAAAKIKEKQIMSANQTILMETYKARLDEFESLHTPGDEYRASAILDQGIPAGANSIAAKLPEVGRELAEVRKSFPNTQEFYNAFKAKNGRPPTLGEVIAYSINQKNTVRKKLLSMVTKYHDQAFGKMIEDALVKIDTSYEKLEETFAKAIKKGDLNAPFDGSNSEHWKMIPHSDLTGAIGELEVASRLDNVGPVGELLGNGKLAPIIIKQVGALDAKVDPAAWAKFKEQYPVIAERIGPGATPKDLEKWLNSKEFDIHQFLPGNRTNWVEVKNYSKPMTLEMIMDASKGSKGKSIFSQAQEAKEIRRFLGQEADAKLSLAFPKGITRAAKEKLNSIGVEAIGQVVD